jgi:hypothetical protein
VHAEILTNQHSGIDLANALESGLGTFFANAEKQLTIDRLVTDCSLALTYAGMRFFAGMDSQAYLHAQLVHAGLAMAGSFQKPWKRMTKIVWCGFHALKALRHNAEKHTASMNEEEKQLQLRFFENAFYGIRNAATLKQAVAYAAFFRFLLRSKTMNQWKTANDEGIGYQSAENVLTIIKERMTKDGSWVTDADDFPDAMAVDESAGGNSQSADLPMVMSELEKRSLFCEWNTLWGETIRVSERIKSTGKTELCIDIFNVRFVLQGDVNPLCNEAFADYFDRQWTPTMLFWARSCFGEGDDTNNRAEASFRIRKNLELLKKKGKVGQFEFEYILAAAKLAKQDLTFQRVSMMTPSMQRTAGKLPKPPRPSDESSTVAEAPSATFEDFDDAETVLPVAKRLKTSNGVPANPVQPEDGKLDGRSFEAWNRHPSKANGDGDKAVMRTSLLDHSLTYFKKEGARPPSFTGALLTEEQQSSFLRAFHNEMEEHVDGRNPAKLKAQVVADKLELMFPGTRWTANMLSKLKQGTYLRLNYSGFAGMVWVANGGINDLLQEIAASKQ